MHSRVQLVGCLISWDLFHGLTWGRFFCFGKASTTTNALFLWVYNASGVKDLPTFGGSVVRGQIARARVADRVR